jgi:membrane protein insertase Oxa1/YidC/SpoIIIJ
MELLWVAVIAVTNFVSVFAAALTLRYLDMRRKRKVAEFLMNEFAEKISTEMDFQEIIKRMKMQEERDGD